MQHEFITGIKRTAQPRTRVAQREPIATNSPVKRFNTVNQTPRATGRGQQQPQGTDGTRPLPEPPATSYKNGTTVPAPSGSPSKGGPGRRHSTFTAGQTGVGRGGPSANAGERRNMTGGAIPAPSASGLPRVAGGAGAGSGQGRSVSGRPDLASAAAAASLAGRRPHL